MVKNKLEIIVCVKQVPSNSDVKMDTQKGTLIREGVKTEINPFDMYAIEEAVRLKERYGASITVISMGPKQAEESIIEAIAMGCDNGILLNDKKFAGADTLATAYTLACGIRKIKNFDMIICGQKTTDGDTGQVGGSLAEELGISCINYVREILELTDESGILERTMDNYYERIRFSLPILITVTKETNEPRYISFKMRRSAMTAPIKILSSGNLNGDGKRFGLDGSPTRVVQIFKPVTHPKGILVKFKKNEQVSQFINKLKEHKII